MKMLSDRFNKGKEIGAAKYSVVLLAVSLFIILGYRGLGYCLDEQAELMLYSRTFAESGKLICYLSTPPLYCNIHPPFLVSILALFIKLSNIHLAPALVLLSCSAATLWLLLKRKKLCFQSKNCNASSISVVLLFFLIPLTHESFLFIDIDNSILPVWAALFLLAIQYEGKWPRNFTLFLGAVFAVGLWCKLTTPIVVFLIWAFLQMLAKPTFATLAKTLLVAFVASALFSLTYFPFCMFFHQPALYPFEITFGKGVSEVSGILNLSARAGAILRSIFLDVHWFTPVLLFIFVLKTIKDFKNVEWKSRDFRSIEAAMYIWGIYLCYTIAVPTAYLPRYKFVLIPFLVSWLSNDFHEFLVKTKPRRLLMIVGAGIGSSLVLPDLGTSASTFQLYFHNYSPLKYWLQGLPYYPDSLTSLLEHLSNLSQATLFQYPVEAFRFVLYFMTWVGIAYLLLTLFILFVINFKVRNATTSLYLIATFVWSCQFAMDMRRDYDLFYCPGTKGFEEIISVLKSKLEKDESIIGNREFSAYTGNPFHQLNQWGDRERSIDTTRLQNLVALHRIRFLVYLNRGDAVNGIAFKEYLGQNFVLQSQIGDYFLWRKIPK
jgi:hypothetical protein